LVYLYYFTYDKHVCYGKERLKHAKNNQRKDTKIAETIKVQNRRRIKIFRV